MPPLKLWRTWKRSRIPISSPAVSTLPPSSACRHCRWCDGITSHATLSDAGITVGIRLAASQGDEERDDDASSLSLVSPHPPPSLTNNSAATSSRRPRGPLTAVQAAEQPGSQAVSHCFLMCFTLPELILAKVLTTPLLSKYAIFWLGTSTIELGEGGASPPLPSSRFFLSFLFFSFFCKREVCYSCRRANPCVRYVYVSTRRGREGGLSPGRQTGRVAPRQIDRQVPFRPRCPRCRQITVYRNMMSGIIRILLGVSGGGWAGSG